MKIAYFNCSSGIAGDMILASCIDAGLSPSHLEKTLKRALKLTGWKLETHITERYHFPARRLDVVGDRHFSSPNEMMRIIMRSSLPEKVKKQSSTILSCLINAESKVHGVPPGKVHFHELNSLDTIIDVTGGCLALEMLGIEEVYSSAVNIGSPAPATAEIIKEKVIPVYSRTCEHELATPTGIAIIANSAKTFGDMPLMTVEKTGLGAGAREIKQHYNLLKLIIGSPVESNNNAFERDEVVVLETNIDDMDPRIYPYVMEKLFQAGAKDVWLTQIIMKKGRPGMVLSVIADTEGEGEMAGILFDETTTLGIRRRVTSRHILRRQLGPGVKTALFPGGKKRVKAEYESAKKKAVFSGKPLKKLIF